MSRPRRTILLVEDESSIREPLAEVLRSEGFETLVAGSVAEALEEARRNTDEALGPRRTPRCHVLSRTDSYGIGTPCVLASERPAHPESVRRSAKAS